MSVRWKALLVLSVLLLAPQAQATAQDGAPNGRVVLWSAQGPVAVDRADAIGPAGPGGVDAQSLLRALLDGPTAQEEEEGLSTAVPEGTTLAAVVEAPGDTVVVRLSVPTKALGDLSHERLEKMVEQIGKTLLPLDWRDLRIQVRDPANGDFVPLASFLPQIEVPLKPSVAVGASPAEADPQGGEPPAPGQGQPSGALTGKTVYVSAGHGWEWNGYLDQWRTQRPPYPSTSYNGPIVEDHNNAEAVNQYLLHYLWNAGAQVWPVRERDINGHQAIVDDGSTGYSDSGWGSAAGGYGGDSRQTATVAGAPTATASWQATLPENGRYAVYVWYDSGGDRTADARYTVHHAGGDTPVSVDQRHHGFTWHFIGTYGFVTDTPARVTLTNQSSHSDRTVVADAVRFGGGTFDSLAGIDTIASWPPNRPWWEVASFYYTQKMGMGAGYGDVTVRPVYARWEHAGTGEDAVYVSWHTNGATGHAQWDYSGTETYAHNGTGLPRTPGSIPLRDTIHAEVVHDIQTGWRGSWIDRGTKQANLGELRLLCDEDTLTGMPGALIEIGFHDHPGDTDALKDPQFNQLVARALYQGIVKYFSPGATLLPEPPSHLAVENVGGGSVRVSWQAPPTDGVGLRGHAASGYRVYTSPNGVGWSNGETVGGVTEHVLSGLSPGQLVYVRVTATNGGGESFPTETLAVRVGDTAELLLVNGFDRLNASMAVLDNETVEGPNIRIYLDQMNSYDYVIQHGEAVQQTSGYAFDSASNEAVKSGRINLNNYTVVDWILGEESVTDQTLDGTERGLLQAFLAGNGALFISGSEIGYDLVEKYRDPWFYESALRADYRGDDAGTYQVGAPWGSIFHGLGSIRFDAQGMYRADFPDVLAAANGSVAALSYEGGTWGTAGVQYENVHNPCQRLVHFGFPFETIWPTQRVGVMSAVLGFLGECLDPVVDTSIETPAYGSAHNTLPSFEGSAQAQHDVLAGVEVQIRHTASGTYWNGSTWVPTASWLNATGAQAWSYPLPPSLDEGRYHLRARGRSEGGELDETPAESFFTYDATAPTETSLIAPTDGATVTALPALVLDWEDVSADGGSGIVYEVELDGESQTTSNSISTRTHIADGSHTWRVRVWDEAGNSSSWTPMETFSVSRLHGFVPLVSRAAGEVLPCSDVVVNGGFENDSGWVLNKLAVYQTSVVHAGSRSARVGIPPGQPGIHAYSSVSQTVILPPGRRGTMRLWVYPVSEGNDPDDLHYIWLHDQSGASHPLELTTRDTRAWVQGEYDVTDFLGQAVKIWVGAVNDGDEETAALYVDDVELEVCP